MGVGGDDLCSPPGTRPGGGRTSHRATTSASVERVKDYIRPETA